VARSLILAVLALAACTRPLPTHGAIVLTDDAEARVVLPGPARRVVSLMPATTELLFALGAGSTLVGRTRWADYPAEALERPSVGDGMAPNVESVAALHPDLVIAYLSPSNGPQVERFRSLGIPVLQLALNRLEDFDRAARLLAAAVGRPAAGDSLTGAVRDELARVTVPRRLPPRIFVLAWDQPPMTLGSGSFLSEIVARAGGVNIFGDEAAPSFTVSIEAVATRNPDLILLTGDEGPDWAKRPEWQVVRAVRERRFLRVTGSEFNRPSPRVAHAVTALADSLTRLGW
jgi:iron complex transport system substrate-binding protein